VWISEQTAIISLYNINWLVFITETQCVYCAVRTCTCHGQLIFSEVTLVWGPKQNTSSAHLYLWCAISPALHAIHWT